jgi:hypothetical protein
MWKEAVRGLEGLRKGTNKICQNSRSLGRAVDLGPTEYEAGMSTTQPWHVVKKGQSYLNLWRPNISHILSEYTQFDFYLESSRRGQAWNIIIKRSKWDLRFSCSEDADIGLLGFNIMWTSRQTYKYDQPVSPQGIITQKTNMNKHTW